MSHSRADFTGVVLAGGRGSRMGGLDKGLQPFRGAPLALHALLRLLPQVGEAMINANRNLDHYRAFGVPVWPDEVPDFAGPLAGLLTALQHCRTPWLVSVPCDTPHYPADLVVRLAQGAIDADAQIALAATHEGGELRPQPVFCLIQASLADSLAAFVHAGGRKVDAWTAQHRAVPVPFPDAAAFFNANTLEELRSIEPR